MTTSSIAAASAALALAFSIGCAFAAEPKPAPAQAAGVALPLPPSTLDLVGSEMNWVKQCYTFEDASGCKVGRAFGPAPLLPPLIQLAVQKTDKDNQVKIVGMFPLELKLQPGFSFTLGDGATYLGAFTICSQEGCRGEIMLDEAALQKVLASETFAARVQNKAGGVVALNGPLKGLAQAWNGPAMSVKDALAEKKRVDALIEKNVRDFNEKSAREAKAAKPEASKAGQ